MRTYKEVLQMVKSASAIVTQVGIKDNLNLAKPPEAFKPVKESPGAGKDAGKAILKTTSTATAEALKKAPIKSTQVSVV